MKRIVLVRKPEADVVPGRGYAYRHKRGRRAAFYVSATHLGGKEPPESLQVERNWRRK